MDGICLLCNQQCFCDAFNAPYLACAEDLLRTCSIVAQSDLDSASLAAELLPTNSPVNGCVEHQVRGLIIPFAVLVPE
jgi:hypothetical protein